MSPPGDPFLRILHSAPCSPLPESQGLHLCASPRALGTQPWECWQCRQRRDTSSRAQAPSPPSSQHSGRRPSSPDDPGSSVQTPPLQHLSPSQGSLLLLGGGARLCPVGGLREAERSGLSRDLPPTALHLSVKLRGGPTCPPCFLFQSQFLAVVSIFNDFFKQPACGLSENLNSPPQRVPFYSHSVLLPTR